MSEIRTDIQMIEYGPVLYSNLERNVVVTLEEDDEGYEFLNSWEKRGANWYPLSGERCSTDKLSGEELLSMAEDLGLKEAKP